MTYIVSQQPSDRVGYSQSQLTAQRHKSILVVLFTYISPTKYEIIYLENLDYMHAYIMQCM